MKSFKDLGVNPQTIFACDYVGWKNPTNIQVEAIPVALEGNDDIIGLAPTGSGKTGAFAIPIQQALLKNPDPFFACVISPTRERAIQVAKQFQALGATIGLRCALLVEGVDGVDDFDPHIVVATPDRLVKHLCNTNVFSLRMLKFLVVDEADRFFNDDFELVDEILNVIPSQRPRIYLFSATMSEEVKKLQRACLKDHVKIVAASKYTLRQHVQEAKGISQMKIKEDDEDDARNHQASEKKHHPGPRPLTELTELRNKLKKKMEEISVPSSPKKTCVKEHGRGSFSYKLVYSDGTTLSVRGGCAVKEGYGRGPLPATTTLLGRRSAASSPARPLGEGKQTLGRNFN